MKILFCSDGSAEAENAVRFGAGIAKGCEAEAAILGISERSGTEDRLLRSLRRSQECLKQVHINAELTTKAGRPVPEIVKRTREAPCDLVVIGAQRRPGHSPVLRSVKAYQIVEAVEPPVLVVMGEARPLKRILLCSAGGVQAEKAVQFAGAIARCAQAEVVLFHVLPSPPALYSRLLGEEDVDGLMHSESALARHLRQQQETIAKCGIRCTVRIRHGLVVPEVLAQVRQAPCDLVVTGSAPARDPLRAYMMGNVTHEIIDNADWPVLVVRTGGVSRGWGRLGESLLSRWRFRPSRGAD